FFDEDHIMQSTPLTDKLGVGVSKKKRSSTSETGTPSEKKRTSHLSSRYRDVITSDGATSSRRGKYASFICRDN
ncbi:MAG: hypothetical protein O0W93_04105, partial [Methanocorpusculum sp.]|nr:hypothetical protein [Methanocorpusculum sp.]